MHIGYSYGYYYRSQVVSATTTTHYSVKELLNMEALHAGMEMDGDDRDK